MAKWDYTWTSQDVITVRQVPELKPNLGKVLELHNWEVVEVVSDGSKAFILWRKRVHWWQKRWCSWWTLEWPRLSTLWKWRRSP